MNPKSPASGFTLIEIVAVVMLLSILIGIGVLRLGNLRSEGQTLAKKDALALVQRMEEMADLEQLTVTATDPLERIKALQQSLLAKGHAYYQINPTNLVQLVQYGTDGWTIAP